MSKWPTPQDWQIALQAPAWIDTIKPWLEAKREQKIHQLVAACVAGADTNKLIKAGTQVSDVQAFLAEPYTIVKKMLDEQAAASEAKAMAQQMAQVDAENADMLQCGRNPFTLTGQPGEPHGDET